MGTQEDRSSRIGSTTAYTARGFPSAALPGPPAAFSRAPSASRPRRVGGGCLIRPEKRQRNPPLLPAGGAVSARPPAELGPGEGCPVRAAAKLARPFWPPPVPEPRGNLRRSSSVPPQRFQALLTFLSEFFSPFRRRTCSLSVFPECLALDGIYHPIWAALPSNPTPRHALAGRTTEGPCTGLSPSTAATLPGGFDPPTARAGRVVRLQFSCPSGHGIQRLGSVRFARRY